MAKLPDSRLRAPLPTTGRFQTAAEAEAAWRARHKWAAQRVAQLLTDLPLRPPLAAASAFLDLSCLRVALPLDADGVGFATLG